MAKRTIDAQEPGEVEVTPQQGEAARRALHHVLMFWRACSEKPCKRARACRGDVHACWQRFRPAIPDELMIELRAVIEARVAGASVEDSVRAGRQRVAQLKATLARVAEREADYGKAQTVQPRLPRVRGM